MTTDVNTITHLVQLAMTPAFMLAGIGAVVSVLAGRLSRAVDRERHIVDIADSLSEREAYRHEMKNLKKRCKIILNALHCTAFAWFCICGVILTIFVSRIFDEKYYSAELISWLFTLSMVLVILAVGLLMKELRLCYELSVSTDWEFLERK